MTQNEFENKWLNKKIRFTQNFNEFESLGKEFIVTAAILNADDSEVPNIFAIRAPDYNFYNREWYTMHLNNENLDTLLSCIEII